jgi:hypothetical protein
MHNILGYFYLTTSLKQGLFSRPQHFKNEDAEEALISNRHCPDDIALVRAFLMPRSRKMTTARRTMSVAYLSCGRVARGAISIGCHAVGVGTAFIQVKIFRTSRGRGIRKVTTRRANAIFNERNRTRATKVNTQLGHVANIDRTFHHRVVAKRWHRNDLRRATHLCDLSKVESKQQHAASVKQSRINASGNR